MDTIYLGFENAETSGIALIEIYFTTIIAVKWQSKL